MTKKQYEKPSLQNLLLNNDFVRTSGEGDNRQQVEGDVIVEWNTTDWGGLK